MSMQRIGLGGGCHWCTEAVFQALRGVGNVEQGFIASAAPYDSFSEAVIVHYDPATIVLNVLIEVHLRTHASTSDHAMRSKYRSAIYCFDAVQAETAQQALAQLQAGFNSPLVTQILSFAAFRASDERFTDYYASNPQRPFCETYIEPKLKHLARHFTAQYRPIHGKTDKLRNNL